MDVSNANYYIPYVEKRVKDRYERKKEVREERNKKREEEREERNKNKKKDNNLKYFKQSHLYCILLT